MRIEVRVTPNARREEIKAGANGGYVVSVRAPAREGKANEAALAALARYFSVPKTTVKIVRGKTGRVKIIEIAAFRSGRIHRRRGYSPDPISG